MFHSNAETSYIHEDYVLYACLPFPEGFYFTDRCWFCCELKRVAVLQ